MEKSRETRIFWEELSITYRAAIAAKLRMILFIQKRDGRVFGRLFFACKNISIAWRPLLGGKSGDRALNAVQFRTMPGTKLFKNGKMKRYGLRNIVFHLFKDLL